MLIKPRIWDTFHTKVVIEWAHPCYVESIPTPLDCIATPFDFSTDIFLSTLQKDLDNASHDCPTSLHDFQPNSS